MKATAPLPPLRLLNVAAECCKGRNSPHTTGRELHLLTGPLADAHFFSALEQWARSQQVTCEPSPGKWRQIRRRTIIQGNQTRLGPLSTGKSSPWSLKTSTTGRAISCSWEVAEDSIFLAPCKNCSPTWAPYCCCMAIWWTCSSGNSKITMQKATTRKQQ